jgi:hypothetical protein
MTDLPTATAAREAAGRRLAAQATGGSLTLEEYVERARALEQAATPEEAEAAASGLPERAGEPPASSPRWLVGVLGGTKQQGRWRLGARLRVVAVLGGVTLDLGRAQPEVPESSITVVAVLGGAELVAPPGVPIAFSGLSLLGGRSDERTPGSPLPGAPLVRVRVLSLLGGVKVTERRARGGAS